MKLRGLAFEVYALAFVRPITIHYAARRLGRSKAGVWKAVHKLEQMGLLKRVRIGNGVYWVAHEIALNYRCRRPGVDAPASLCTPA
ncbi:hypothetical protein Pogu_2104 [Pyrobaculum oguniense TE7]|uniref:Sugar-specific transcriptional regulator TrmB n=1 Tax=Pyrobaculum oguniense (strain DSM 13380 / JCM 10595 / TE7) TaxID=698757 RepID=H6QCT5_PYROT|nr:hypothetical protein Pogu_2104 [Pyrobaculum oguniense TE7]